MKIPAGPDGSLTSLIADGKLSRSVRRLPSGSLIEIRPECNAMLPVSETSKLPWFVSAEPSGWRRPVVTSEHWAEAVAVSENNKSENMVEKLNHLSIFLYMGVSFLTNGSRLKRLYLLTRERRLKSGKCQKHFQH